MALTLYRIVRSDPPTLIDFTSNHQRGMPTRSTDPEVIRLWSGLSCWSTAAQARRLARNFPALGTHIAVMYIDPDAAIRVERTRGPGHHTVWGEPMRLLACVTSIEPL